MCPEVNLYGEGEEQERIFDQGGRYLIVKEG
jgi:hypothetical protein